MAFCLTLVYVALNLLSPADIFPALKLLHVMQWVAVAAVFAAVGHLLAKSRSPWSAQAGQMIGLLLAVALSHLAHLSFGGAFLALIEFLKPAIVFFMVIATVDSVRKLRVLIAVVVLVSMTLAGQSLVALATWSSDQPNPYVVHQRVMLTADAEPTDLARVRSVGMLEDPNDFAQHLLVVASLLLVGWKARRWTRNTWLVLMPAAFLLCTAYFTHSRGALVGLAVFAWLVVERTINKTTALIVAGLVVAGLLGIEAVGTRAISFDEGSVAGRVMAWGAGIGMLKASPLFGAGFATFLDYNDMTAHNAFVLCFAELGLFGYFFWLSLIVYSLTDVNGIIGSARLQEDEADLVQCAATVRVALATFLATSWFLSRTYVLMFYLLIGMAVVVRRLAPQASVTPFFGRYRWALTGMVEIASIIAVYGVVRLRSL